MSPTSQKLVCKRVRVSTVVGAMKPLLLGLALLISGSNLTADSYNWVKGEPECLKVLEDMKLPARLEDGGNDTANWRQVNQTLLKLHRSLQGKSCALKFSQVFRSSDLEYLPVTNAVLGVAPEASLKSLAIHAELGGPVGHFERKVSVEEEDSFNSVLPYRFYFFHFRDGNDRVQSSGNRLLHSDFRIRWTDLENRTAVSTMGEEDRAR